MPEEKREREGRSMELGCLRAGVGGVSVSLVQGCMVGLDRRRGWGAERGRVHGCVLVIHWGCSLAPECKIDGRKMHRRQPDLQGSAQLTGRSPTAERRESGIGVTPLRVPEVSKREERSSPRPSR